MTTIGHHTYEQPLRIHIDVQLGVFLVLRDGLSTSYARLFLASTNARFYKELDREMLNKRRF